jgi:hypothetical protein
MLLRGTTPQLLILCTFLSLSSIAKNATPNVGGNFTKPLCFIENKGQVRDVNGQRQDVQFQLTTPGVHMYVGSGSLRYEFRKKEADGLKSYTVGVELVGCNKQSQIETEQQNAYYENYYLSSGGTPSFTAHAYSKVRYKEVYPGIDWVLYVKDGQVEYDFVVKSNADARNIKISYSGASEVKLASDGSVAVTTPLGTIKEHQPYTYQTATGDVVASKFTLSNRVLAFELGKHTGGITIDPFLSWATYYGGTNDDAIQSVKCATGGDIYVCGTTVSTDFPTTVGVFSTTSFGNTDAFVAKFNSSGSPLWATYFGGTNADAATAIDVESSGGAVFVVGNTRSTGLASSAGVHKPTFSFGTGDDMFLGKFSSTGTRSYSTYIGGVSNDQATSVSCDGSGNVYVGGLTSSAPFGFFSMATDGTRLGGTQDGYLGKFSQSGVGARIWSTYFGGGRFDQIDAVASDASGNVVITGITSSDTGIATSTGAQTVLGSSGTGFDAFVVRYSSSGITLWGTYLGGNANDQGLAIALDRSNNIYVTGTTSSPDSIAIGYAETNALSSGAQDGFVHKYNVSGVPQWGTYIAGNGLDNPDGIAVDILDNVVVSGYTASTSGLSTSGAFQTSNGGAADAFVIKYSSIGQKYYATYYGAAQNDLGNSVTTDVSTGDVIIGGSTRSTSGIATSGAAQTSMRGGSTTGDGMLVKFAPDTLVSIREPFVDTLVCAGGTFTLSDTTINLFASGNTFSVQLSDASGSFASPVTIGSSTTRSSGSITCVIPSGTTAGSGYRLRIVASNPSYTSPINRFPIRIVSSLPTPFIVGTPLICIGQTISLLDSVTYPVSAYSWTGPSSFSAASRRVTITSATGANTGLYSVVTSHVGCPDVTSTFSVTVNTFIPPAPFDSSNAPICENGTLLLFARPAVSGIFSFNWSGPLGFISTSQNPVLTSVTAARSGTYSVTNTLNACTSPASSITIDVLPLDTPNINISVSPNDTVCVGTMLNFTATTTGAGYSPTFQWMTSPTNPIVGAIFSRYSIPAVYPGGSIFCVLRNNSRCPDRPYDTSNVINLSVLDNTPPVVITVSPDSNIAYNGAATFSGYIGGYSITGFRWYVNNMPLSDTTLTITLRNVTSVKSVRLEATNSELCSNVGVSNTITLRVPASVGPEVGVLDAMQLVPNPNNGSFEVLGVCGSANGSMVDFAMVNAVGQSVYTGSASIVNGQLRHQVDVRDLPTGLYVLTLRAEGLVHVIRFNKE